MTKKHAVIVVVILVVVVCLVVAMSGGIFGVVTQGNEIAKIGNYTLTESDLREYIILTAFDKTSAETVKTLETAAQAYARAKIAADEIAGTQYDISPEYRKNLLTQENQKAQKEKEEDTAFRARHGISREELTRAVVTSKMNVEYKTKHAVLFTEQLQKEEEDQGLKVSHTPDELLSLYKEYVEKKVDTMEFVILDTERVNDVQVFLDSILEKAEK